MLCKMILSNAQEKWPSYNAAHLTGSTHPPLGSQDQDALEKLGMDLVKTHRVCEKSPG
jgi:hypothetical protein